MENLEKLVDQLACKVMEGDKLKDFLELDIESKLIGLAALAHIGKDRLIRDLCLVGLRQVRQARRLAAR